MLKARRSDRPPATNKPIKKSSTIKNNYNSKFDGRGRYNPATDGPPETKGEAEIYQSFLNNRKQIIVTNGII